MSTRAWLILFLLSLIWGAAFTFAGAAVREMGFLTVVFLRVGIAAAALLILLALRGQLPALSLGLMGAFLVMGLFNNAIPFSLLFWAQSPPLGSEVPKVSSGLASILNATTPIFSMLIATFAFRDETLSARKMGGIALALLGLIFLFAGQGGGFGLSTLGLMACVGAALSYGFAVAFGRRFGRQGLTPTQGALGQLCASTLLMAPLALLIDQPWLAPAPSSVFWLSILGLALLSSALAYFLYFWLIANAGATNAALVTLLVPASAMVLGAVFLGEGFGLSDFAGLASIALGLLVIDGRVIGALRTRRR